MALCLPPCGNDCATVECARNNFEIQLPRKSDFRRVITVERYVFKDREEITLELSVRLRNRIGGMALPGSAEDRSGIVHGAQKRSEEHTSELQSQSNIVCRLLLETKNNK